MASLKKCIEEKCKQCTYDPQARGSWREQVEICAVKSCPLWEVRPVSVATITARRQAKGTTLIGGVDIDTIIAGLDDEEEVVQ